jgi:hypothetical protein
LAAKNSGALLPNPSPHSDCERVYVGTNSL